MKKVVFYSSNSKYRDKDSNSTVFPKWSEQWDLMAARHQDSEIYLVVQLNGRYFLDIHNGELTHTPEKIKLKVLPMEAKIPEFIEAIAALNPDIVIAMPGPVSGYDWNGIRDAAIAEGLTEKGFKTICYSAKTALDCFDKWRTQEVLQQHGFKTPDGLYLHYDLFKSDKLSKVSTGNVYTEYILFEISRMKMPVVIKSTTGSSSMGIYVATSYEDAKTYLLSDRLREDVLLQEFLKGDEYGMEVHGSKGNYIVSPPFRIFNTKEGELNDPLGATTIKYGPILDESLKIEALREEMLRLANVMDFCGIMEVDLILYKGEWYILEINNRWSGLTTLVTASQGRVPYEVYMEQYDKTSVNLNDIKNLKFACQFKMPGADCESLSKIATEDMVTSVIQYEVKMPGKPPYFFNDAVIGGFSCMQDLIEGFASLQQKYAKEIDKNLVLALKEKEGY